VTGYHAAHLTHNRSRAIVWAVVARHLSAWIDPKAAVLEVGAGYCDWINNVTAARRVAVDIWPDMTTFAAPGVEAVVLDAARDLKTLGQSAFDVVLASNVLEHFPPDTAASVVADIAAVLRPGGRVILIQPNFRQSPHRYFDDYTHRAVFTDISLPALLRSQGFHIELVKRRFLPYSMNQARMRVRPWMVTAYLHSPLKPMAGQMLVIGRKA
jgi:SAM-dependent methyltransferase